MVKWKDMLEKGHFDIHDLIAWTDSQAVKCGREDYKIIYQKFSRLLARLKEDRRKIFDERLILQEEPELEIPKPPKMQMVRRKIRGVIDTYKGLLGRE